MLRPLYVLIFKCLGWKIEGSFPATLKKYLVAVAPHTSNWDFVVGVMARSILRMQRTKFLGKDSLFKAPYGWFFRWLGGHPVDRTHKHDLVRQVVEIFNNHEEFVLALAPEGTRKKVTKLRTGFYYIALGAGVPIIPCGFDFARKRIVIGTPFLPTGNADRDLQHLIKFYSAIKGKNPQSGIDSTTLTASIS
ncbi:MAG: lysophospholipid acyltransferase family protein [Cyclobacteriaceae bacterium]|nr:lysophospholipid acyltransferase family protein [Cyclobacteriaceae bacterium]